MHTTPTIYPDNQPVGGVRGCARRTSRRTNITKDAQLGVTLRTPIMRCVFSKESQIISACPEVIYMIDYIPYAHTAVTLLLRHRHRHHQISYPTYVAWKSHKRENMVYERGIEWQWAVLRQQ